MAKKDPSKSDPLPTQEQLNKKNPPLDRKQTEKK